VKNLVLVPEMATARARGLKDVTRRLNTNVKPGDVVYHGEILYPQEFGGYAVYRRDGAPVVPHTEWRWERQTLSSRFCPQSCARLFSMIRSVREERLQDITTEDIAREGLRVDYSVNDRPDVLEAEQREAFSQLWDRLHPTDPWSTDPYLYRIELGPNLTRDEAVRLAGIRDVGARLEAGKVAA
jgi:hypothetical protein